MGTPEQCKAWRKANAEKVKENNKRYYEENKEAILVRTNAWKADNAERVSDANKAWIAANIDRKRATTKAWRESNPDRVKGWVAKRRAILEGATATLTVQEWQDVWVEFEGLCFWCEAEASQMDHIVPLAPRAGTPQGHHTKKNVVPACQPCNSKKINQDPLLFLFQTREASK